MQVNDQVLGINDTNVTAMTADHANSVLQSFGTHANILIGFTVGGLSNYFVIDCDLSGETLNVNI